MSAHFTLGFTATFSDLRRPSALVLKSSASLANLRNISFAAVTLYVFTETNERVQKQTWNSKQQPSLGAISSGRLVGHSHCGKFLAPRTFSAVTRPTCKVNGKGRTLTQWHQNHWNFFKFELDVRDYVPEIYINASFHFSPFSGGFSPGRWNITVLWLYPGKLLGCSVFFYCRARTQVQPVDGFSRFMTHTTCFHQRTVLLGVATISEFICG